VVQLQFVSHVHLLGTVQACLRGLGKRRNVRVVTAADGGFVLLQSESLVRVLADGLQHAEARLATRAVQPTDQAAVDQGLHAVDHLVGRQPRSAALGSALAMVLATLLGPETAVVHADGTCTTTGGQVSCTFASTGAEQTFTVPAGISTVQVTAIGAAGAPTYGVPASLGVPPPPGGRGAQVTGTLTGISGGQTLYVEVGGAPTTTPGCYLSVACVGGFNRTCP
jgi:hypothetical protein